MEISNDRVSRATQNQSTWEVYRTVSCGSSQEGNESRGEDKHAAKVGEPSDREDAAPTVKSFVATGVGVMKVVVGLRFAYMYARAPGRRVGREGKLESTL